MKKQNPDNEKAVSKAKAEKPVAVTVTQAKPKKSSPDKSASKTAKSSATKANPTKPEIAVSERIGMTAGSIWHYLDKNGATLVAKLIRELPEDEKIIQRSIGWLAQEGKISLDSTGRVEIIALKY